MKANNSSFLPLMLLMFILKNFNPPINLLLLVKVEGAEDLVLSLFPSGLNLFSLSKFNCSSKKESEKLKKSYFGQIQVQFVFCMVSYCESDRKEQSLCTHISHLSH